MLRPLAQDYLLPTIAYIGGPAEVAYHAQIGPSYAHFGIPRPVIFPRPSFSLVDAATARAMEAEGLSFEELQTDTETLLARAAREANPEVEASFADSARRGRSARSAASRRPSRKLDPTLRGAAQSAARPRPSSDGGSSGEGAAHHEAAGRDARRAHAPHA